MAKGVTSHRAVAALMQTALTWHRQGDLGRARSAYRSVLSRRPGHADALHLLGVVALDEGRTQAAVELIGRALAADPTNASAHNNLGNALRRLQRPAEATRCYREAMARGPALAEPPYNLALLALAEGRVLEAQTLFAAALACSPDMIAARIGLGRAQRAAGDLDAAEASLRQALSALSGGAARAEAVGELAQVKAEQDDTEAALALHDEAIGLAPRDASLQIAKGLTHLRGARYAQALAQFEAVTALAPGGVEGWLHLGRARRILGDIPGAARAFEEAARLDPACADAHRNLALIEAPPRPTEAASGRGAPDAVRQLETLAKGGALSLHERALAGFALGKRLDAADRYDEAFAAYAAANSAMQALHASAGRRFDPGALWRQVEAGLEACPAVRTAPGRQTPVFVVGMPRSGTSLVEQIIASHPMAAGAGELRDGLRLARSLADPVAASTAARAYLARLEALGEGAARVVDKMPDNVFHLRALAALLPGARFVFCRRGPEATGLSCFFQHFSSGNLFAYDLVHCGLRWRAVERLGEDAAQALGTRLLTVGYEEVVADLEGQARRLIAFLDLPWDDRCLAFHQTARPVATASGWQVRQPLYAGQVDHWRRYAAHLAPLYEGLSAPRARPVHAGSPEREDRARRLIK